MENEASEFFIDELFDPEWMLFDNYVEELSFNDLCHDEQVYEYLPSPSPPSFMINSEGEEDNSFNHFEDNCPSSFNSFEEQNIIEHIPSFDITNSQPISLSFINPPESFYHVRYTSEITDSPVNGGVVNNRMKTKKHISGRYLKGLRGRHITIMLPKSTFNCSNLYIRVTRLTVPYQNVSYIHPYPVLYSSKKEKSHSRMISKDSSIYFKVSKDEIRSGSKQFPNIIFTRLKQCDLNKMKHLYSFDTSDTAHPFLGDNAKDKIARYNLKKSEIDFRLVNLSEQTHEFIDTGIYCRSNALLEAEGVKWRK